MSSFRTQRFNRAYVDKLKSKGKVWLESTIQIEEQKLKACSEEDLGDIDLYLVILNKALKELELSNSNL
jgi:hypothetical protein